MIITGSKLVTFVASFRIDSSTHRIKPDKIRLLLINPRTAGGANVAPLGFSGITQWPDRIF